MNEDVTRVGGFAAKIAIDDMLNSVSMGALFNAAEDAKSAIDAIFNSMQAKFKYENSVQEPTMNKTISFYRASGKFGCFSNFSRHSVYIYGKTWPTTEHFFQAQKFVDEPDEEQIRRAATPGLAATMGRDRSRPLREDWEEVKDDIMRIALHAKFTQHEDLKKTLLETEGYELIEHTENDSYWGDGGDGSGKNMLGKLLMEVREELLENE
jgi:ribA/ribD-fused uncharacterized protein